MVFRIRQNKNSPLLQKHITTIEKILSMIDINPEAARAHSLESYRWIFAWGSASVEVNIVERGSKAYFQVSSPIIYLPVSNREQIYQAMLEHNLEMTSAAFGVWGDVGYIFSERPIEGMDSEEARFIITQVSYYADEYDNKFVNEYGGKLYE